MILHKGGKFNGDVNSLPQREHPEGARMFREPDDMKKLGLIANIGAIFLFLALFILMLQRVTDFYDSGISEWIAILCSLLIIIPHEMLHAVCFRGDVYIYSSLKQGIFFVVGTEDMSKARFIFMCMFPNLIFGILPYLLFFFQPRLFAIGIFGAMCTAMGFGDYINVVNALTQVPNGALVYMSGMHSYWYRK